MNLTLNKLTTDFEPGIDNNLLPELPTKSIIIKPKNIATPITKKEMIFLRIINNNIKPPEIDTLKNISYKSINDKQHKFKQLYKLLYSEELMFIAASNMITKIGATTKGINFDTSDALTLKKIYLIISKLKNNNFTFNPIKRLYISKLGKDKDFDLKTQKLFQKNQLTKEKLKELKARPLGILTFSDKIVSEGIRIILNAIYEPEFSQLNCSFGYRPNIGVQEAIRNHTKLAKAHNYMIEADITGAFDNVNHEKLISILTNKIDDEKFINLIKKALESGICYCGQFFNTKIGTTQGSPLSPILYNIYFHEFDKFITKDFFYYIQELNHKENRIDTAKNPLWVKITKEKSKIKRQISLKNLINAYSQFGKNSFEFLKSKTEWELIRQKYNLLDKKQKTLQCINAKRKTIKYTYTRYADDWIFSSNCTIERMQEFKQLFSDWLSNNLFLELSKQKTIITKLSLQKHNKTQEKAKFLGYTLTYYSDKTKHIKRHGINRKFRIDSVIRTKVKSIPFITKLLTPNTKVISHVSLIVSIDKKRILDRFILARIIKKKGNQYFGTRKAEWSVLSPHEIVEKYNQIIRGYINFYSINLTYPSELNFIHYLLKYSCMHTLANKYRTSLSKIIHKFTSNIIIKSSIEANNKGVNTSKEKSTELLTWKDCQDIMRKAIKNYNSKTSNISNNILDNICCPKTNWRTRYKLTKYCCICGSTENIEYHHVRHIKVGKVTGFLQVLKQLNRKQIPTCKYCHDNIHSGKYNSIALSDLFDERLILL